VGFSALTIPVPVLESIVAPRLRHSMPEYLPTDPARAHAHITLLGPFAPREQVDDAVLAELAQFFADVTPFTFAFAKRPRILAGRWIVLEPEPSERFATLTAALTARFPPYANEIDDFLPHLTLEYHGSTRALHDLTTQLAPALPIRAVADRAALAWYEPGGSGWLAAFPFGE